jgi:hypothetical protein
LTITVELSGRLAMRLSLGAASRQTHLLWRIEDTDFDRRHRLAERSFPGDDGRRLALGLADDRRWRELAVGRGALERRRIHGDEHRTDADSDGQKHPL